MSGEVWSAQGNIGRVLVFRLPPGLDLMDAIRKQVEAAGFKSAVVLGGAASLRRAVLRNVKSSPKEWPITDENRHYTTVEGPLELLALSGNLARNADRSFMVHLHATVSGADGAVHGGHVVKGAIILSTGEIAVAELTGMVLTRSFNDETKTYELKPETQE
ncbi:MAG: DNA-binding protein [Bacillota bacterium]|nr:DNA-binding protein [Bacillota bacterium]